MKEAFDLIKERLEEESKFAVSLLNGKTDRYVAGVCDTNKKAIKIVSEVEAEYTKNIMDALLEAKKNCGEDSDCSQCPFGCEDGCRLQALQITGGNNGWIPCSEKLPEPHLTYDIFKRPDRFITESVLVTVKSVECDGEKYYVGMDIMTGTNKEDMHWLMSCGYGGSAVYNQEIIAWMPKPAAYLGKCIEVDCRQCTNCTGKSCEVYGDNADEAVKGCAADNFKNFKTKER